MNSYKIFPNSQNNKRNYTMMIFIILKIYEANRMCKGRC